MKSGPGGICTDGGDGTGETATVCACGAVETAAYFSEVCLRRLSLGGSPAYPLSPGGERDDPTRAGGFCSDQRRIHSLPKLPASAEKGERIAGFVIPRMAAFFEEFRAREIRPRRDLH